MKKLLKADNLELCILEEFDNAWNMRPGEGDYFPIQQIWDNVYKKVGSKIDGPLAQGILNNLLSRRLIEAIKTDRGEIAARLTFTGKEYYISAKDKKRTRMIALIGAITGSLGLFLSILKIILDIVLKPSSG